MKNISTGAGLAIVGLGIALHPVLSNVLAASPSASAALPTSLVASAVAAQAAPTVVWYGVSSPTMSNGDYKLGVLFRAWSDGTIEGKLFYPQQGGSGQFCGPYDNCGHWTVFSSPDQGTKAAADINADEKIDGVDLASILGNWGDAPRAPFPPSDCPLNLTNP